jgi:hypothetical protein
VQSSWAHNWSEFSTELIIGGKTSDNIPYLKLFLQDYKKEFHIEVLNAACQKCIYQYHKDLVKKYSKMENKSQYKLHAKREGIQLEFGGSLFITNENITDRYAEKLIKRFKENNPDFKLEDLFEVFPTEEIKQVAETPKKQPRKPRK